MGMMEKLLGTVSSSFQIGRRGPLLKNSSGAVENRNATDTGYAVARGSDPVGINDLVTKQWAQANLGGGGVVGTATLNFGVFPGTSDATVAVAGQAGILSTSTVRAWIFPSVTADHSIDEHMIETLSVFASTLVAGIGFTIYGFNYDNNSETPRLVGAGGIGRFTSGKQANIYGAWNIGWSWQ